MARRTTTPRTQSPPATPPAAPVAAPPAPAKSMADTITRAQLAQIANKVKRGATVTQAELQFLQRQQASESGSAWPDREACAKELTDAFKDSIRIGTLYEWVRRGAPIPRQGTIDKLALYRWLACEKRLAGRPVGGSSAPSDKKERLLERQITKLGLHINTVAGTMVPIDDAALVIDTAVEDLKTALRHDLPSKAAMVARDAGTAELAVDEIRAIVDKVLAEIASKAEQFKAKASKAKQVLQEASS